MGYSWRARRTAGLDHRQQQRLRSAIFGGIGIGLIEGGGPGETSQKSGGILARRSHPNPVGRTFRDFATRPASDRRAMAACLSGSRVMTREEAAGSPCRY